MRRTVPLTLLALLALALVACNDDGPTRPRTATMRWVLEDSCADGLGIQARIFDVDFGQVWPSVDQVFFSPAGGEIDTSITCERGALLCYGATTDPETNIFWGLDIDGSQNCDDCCERCADGTVDFILNC